MLAPFPFFLLGKQKGGLEQWQPSYDHGRWKVKKSLSSCADCAAAISGPCFTRQLNLYLFKPWLVGFSAVTFLTDEAGSTGGSGMKTNPTQRSDVGAGGGLTLFSLWVKTRTEAQRG